MKNNRTRLLGRDPIIPNICQSPGIKGLVSVIIPTYNRGYIIDKAIESILSQSYSPIELIVIDDGSDDNTKDIIKKYGNKVQYIYQNNSGLAAARNAGLAVASGEYIAFQDSDDVWMPWKLTAQTAMMRKFPELAIIWTDMIAVTPEGQIVNNRYLRTMYAAYQKISIDNYLDQKGTLNELEHNLPLELNNTKFYYGDIYSAMFFGNLVHPPTALLRREHLRLSGGLDITFAWTCEDYEFFWRLSKYGLGGIIEASSILYRVEAPDQLTKPNLLLYVARGNLLSLKRRLEDKTRPIEATFKEIRSQLSQAYNWVANEEIKSSDGKLSQAFFSFLLGFLLNPINYKPHLHTLIRILIPKALINSLIKYLKRKRRTKKAFLNKLLHFPAIMYPILKFLSVDLFC